MTGMGIENGYGPDVAKVWLLEPDGTPTGDYRWDRKLRVDGEQTASSRFMWARFADGERGLWQWVVEHLHRGRQQGDANLVYPIAVEMWGQREAGDWRHWVLPRAQPEYPISKAPADEDGWPVAEWCVMENPMWPCPVVGEPRAWWFTVEAERPGDAPPPLTDDEARVA